MAPRLKFAVVREDSRLESRLVQQSRARAALVVASGGCTALCLKDAFPELEVAAFDLNPAQLAHVEAKAHAVARGDLAALNVEDANAGHLNQRGEFERLFRVLRHFLCELVLTEEELAGFFRPEVNLVERSALLARWRANPYWAAAFHAAFGDSFLLAMFGPDATRHAQQGSYPAYFRNVFERGLAREDAAHNPFLQHVLLQRYLHADAPRYALARKQLEVQLHEGSLLEVPELERFDVVSLSNVFDWSDDALVERWASRLARECRPGTLVLLRQLNNSRPLGSFFAPFFESDRALGKELWVADRSLFYERVVVLRRTTA